MAFNLIYLFNRAEDLKELAMELLSLHLQPPNVAASFDFKDAQKAIRHLQTGKATGKIVLNLDTGLPPD